MISTGIYRFEDHGTAGQHLEEAMVEKMTLADELEAAIEAWHDCAPGGQGEGWADGATEKFNAMAQLFYDSSDAILTALRTLAPDDLPDLGGGGLVEHLYGPHEWGYRDPVTGDFIADDAPFKAADVLRAPQPTRNEVMEEAANVIRQMIPEPAGSPTAHTNTMRVVLFDALRAILALKTTPTEQSRVLTVDQPSEGVVECHGLDTPERVCFYEQDFYVLSNFSAFAVEWSGFLFSTSEHLYHWLRFTLSEHVHGQSAAKEVKNARSAHAAFKLAQENKPYQAAHWDDVKVGTMKRILHAKADQHEYVRRKLLDTGDRELVENSWRDDFWGWGPNRDGQNMLGKLWMEVREELRAALTKGQQP